MFGQRQVRDDHPENYSASRSLAVCVVDPAAEDYAAWQAQAQQAGVRLLFAASAEAALRLARGESIDLWVASTQLPGISGCELCGMLKARSATTPVYLVAGEETDDALDLERRAYAARATMFGRKPGHADWLRQWIANRQPVPTNELATHLGS
jgi:CheY-like chemotaxis protein